MRQGFLGQRDVRIIGVRTGAEPGDPLVHDRRRIRHRADDGHARGESRLDGRGGDCSCDRQHGLFVGDHVPDVLEQEGDVLRLDGDHDERSTCCSIARSTRSPRSRGVRRARSPAPRADSRPKCPPACASPRRGGRRSALRRSCPRPKLRFVARRPPSTQSLEAAGAAARVSRQAARFGRRRALRPASGSAPGTRPLDQPSIRS